MWKSLVILPFFLGTAFAAVPTIQKQIFLNFALGENNESDLENRLDFPIQNEFATTEFILPDEDPSSFVEMTGGRPLRFKLNLPENVDNLRLDFTLIGYPDNTATTFKVKFNGANPTFDVEVPGQSEVGTYSLDVPASSLKVGVNEVSIATLKGYIGLQTLAISFETTPNLSFPLGSGRLYIVGSSPLDRKVGKDQPLNISWDSENVLPGTVMTVQYRAKSGNFRDVPGGVNILFNHPNRDPSATATRGNLSWNSPEDLDSVELRFLAGSKTVLAPSRVLKICQGEGAQPQEAPLYQALLRLVRISDCLDIEDALRSLSSLNLSHQNLQDVSLLSDFAQIAQLDLSHNKLGDTTDLAPLKNLKTLNLSHNGLQSAQGLAGLSQLESLNLSHNLLPDIDALAGLGKLKNLDISFNQVSNVDKFLQKPFDSFSFGGNYLCEDGHGFDTTWVSTISGGKINYLCESGKIIVKSMVCIAGLTAHNGACVSSASIPKTCAGGVKAGETTKVAVEGGSRTLLCKADGNLAFQSISCQSGFSAKGESCVKDPVIIRCSNGALEGQEWRKNIDGGSVRELCQPDGSLLITGVTCWDGFERRGDFCARIPEPEPEPEVEEPEVEEPEIDPKDTMRFDRPVSFVIRNSNKCLDVRDRSKAAGARLQQWACGNGSQQKFHLDYAGNGYYMLRNVNSNLCVSAEGVKMGNGVPMIQWECHGGPDQLVRFEKSRDGSYLVRFSHSNKCMDVQNTSSDNGLEIHQWDCVGVPDQDFYLRP